jgi:hypothetical protein
MRRQSACRRIDGSISPPCAAAAMTADQSPRDHAAQSTMTAAPNLPCLRLQQRLVELSAAHSAPMPASPPMYPK